MITEETRRRYHAHRRAGGLPRYFQVKKPVLPFEWDKGEYVIYGRRQWAKKALWTDDVFRYVAYVLDDNVPGEDKNEHLGEFVEDGAFPDELKRTRGDTRTYTHFRPSYSIRERVKDLRLDGWAKGPAWDEAVRQVRGDMKRLEDYYADEWFYVGIVVYAWPLTVEDPEDEKAWGEDACWGYESDDEAYLNGATLEHASEAAHQALMKEERACAKRGQTHFGFMGVGA